MTHRDAISPRQGYDRHGPTAYLCSAMKLPHVNMMNGDQLNIRFSPAVVKNEEGTRKMRWYRVESLDGLVRSRYGVDEPAEDPAFEVDPSQSENAVALVPGLEFDRQGYRLGYGGGFYDTFLSAFPGVSVGLCRSKFLQDDPIDRDVHDLSVGIIATDAEVVRLK